MLKKIIFLTIGILLILVVMIQQGIGYDLMLRWIYHPSIETINTEALHKKMRQGQQILLLDTRSPNEFRVSHLEGATFVNFDDFQIKQIKTPPTQEIILYCSVGYRSERIAEKLREAGFTNVKNLYGGIFAWKNDGYPLVKNKDTPTDEVHAYNQFWGIWLKRGIKVYD